MHKLMTLMMVWLFLSFPARAENNPLPPVPEGGIRTVFQGECNNNGTDGICRIAVDRDGTEYLVFYVDQAIQEIRQMVDGELVVIWSATLGEPI